MTPVTRESYRVGVPRDGSWQEVLNSDSARYGGSGGGNPNPVTAHPTPWDGRDFAVDLVLPGMSVLFLAPARPAAPGPKAKSETVTRKA